MMLLYNKKINFAIEFYNLYRHDENSANGKGKDRFRTIAFSGLKRTLREFRPVRRIGIRLRFETETGAFSDGLPFFSDKTA